MNRIRYISGIVATAFTFLLFSIQFSDGNEQSISRYEKVKEYVSARGSSKFVLCPEGEFIGVFNEDVIGWVKEEVNNELIRKIKAALATHLYIELNEKGFAQAAARATGGEKDDTNYDAIWVRDNVWVYFSLLADPARRDDAKKLLLALWDYYATEAQIERFENVIADPGLKTDQMAMPHIRFDGKSPELGDVLEDGKPQVWNHRQIDAHGLFFTALGEAVGKGLVNKEDLTDRRGRVLSLYPIFLDKIEFWNYEDAGAWEELPRKNSSSIGLAARSLEVWRELFYDEGGHGSEFREKFSDMLGKYNKETAEMWEETALKELSQKGVATVKKQLMMGGESPDYLPEDIHFRLADAALIFLIQPSPLKGLTEEEMRKIVLIVETLRRPFGVLRYGNDSYQAGNYWIKPADLGENPSLTGDTSSKDAFLWRLSCMMPDTEAQWFFDSILAMVRLHLAETTQSPELRRNDIHAAKIHFKRALGQITKNGITADGRKVSPMLLPESINTVVIDEHNYYLPSPIAPLNWSKAGMAMALEKLRSNFTE